MKTTLSQEKCAACHAGSPQVTPADIAEMYPQVPGWQLIEEEGIQKLTREFELRDFVTALAFTNIVGVVAEQEGHHPRIVTEWGKVGVTWWTHKIGGLHRNDFVMAAKTDEAYTSVLVRS